MFTAITASRQIIQTTLLQSYNSEIPLLQLIKYKVQAAWQEYVRVNYLTEESVENYLVAVSTFKPKYNADFYASDDEDDFYSSAVDSVANDLDTEALYFKLLRQEKLNIALADLRKPDRLLVEYVYGICPKCLLNKKRKTLREASLLLGLTEDGAEKKLKNILNKLKKSIEE